MSRRVCHNFITDTMKKMHPSVRTLVLCGDVWHPAEVVQRGLGALGDAPLAFEFITHGAKWSPALMKEFPLVIVAKANYLCAMDQTPWLTRETQCAFRDFVAQGGGLFLVHAGTCYKDLAEMRAVAGGAFMSHPDQCVVTVQPKTGHSMTAGVSSFSERDEHYLMALDDVKADVFLQTCSEHGVQPAGWTRAEGRGRVCVLTPGHNVGVWLHPEFQKLLWNGLRWLTKLN
jgi:type 1 glutamine amidotransferase